MHYSELHGVRKLKMHGAGGDLSKGILIYHL